MPSVKVSATAIVSGPQLIHLNLGPLPELPENPTTGDNTVILALEALNASDYAHAFTLVNEAIEQGISWDQGKAEALNLRGTFKFLMTDVDGAKEDFLTSLELQPSLTQTWVKIASVWMEQSDPTKAFECFEEAIKHNPNDPDIYYHRGQGMSQSLFRECAFDASRTQCYSS